MFDCCGQFSFSSPFLKPSELQQTKFCCTPLTRRLVLFVLWFIRTIIKVFVKHKILSIETIQSTHTHTHKHAHIHTCMCTHTDTHRHFLTDGITASYTYGQMFKFGPQMKMQKCLKTQNKKMFPSAGFLQLLYLHLNIKSFHFWASKCGVIPVSSSSMKSRKRLASDIIQQTLMPHLPTWSVTSKIQSIGRKMAVLRTKFSGL